MIYVHGIDCVPKRQYERLREECFKTESENLVLLQECKRLNEKLDRIESLYKLLIGELGGK